VKLLVLYQLSAIWHAALNST